MNLHPIDAARVGWRVFRGQPAAVVTFPTGTYEIPGTIETEGSVALAIRGGHMTFEGPITWEGPAPEWMEEVGGKWRPKRNPVD